MNAHSGLLTFGRFAFPPNSLGYCGPTDTRTFKELVNGGPAGIDEVRHLVPAFDGAWPYLELIANHTVHDPLDLQVVEAYWLGGSLLERVDLLAVGNSIDDRFRRRAGRGWSLVSDSLEAGARPTHSFHVFCVYPWVGLLRSGVVDPALHVLDRCRIRWGQVMGKEGDRFLVHVRPLVWDGRRLTLGPERVEAVLPPVDEQMIGDGDHVAMHWEHICQRVSPSQLRDLQRAHARHLAIANRSGRPLASRLDF